TYDRVGNRISRKGTLGGVTAQTQRFDRRDQLDNDDDPSTPSRWFDANGNTTNFVGKVCEYDLENRLIGANGGAVRMAYDGDDHRVRKTSPATGSGSKTT